MLEKTAIENDTITIHNTRRNSICNTGRFIFPLKRSALKQSMESRNKAYPEVKIITVAFIKIVGINEKRHTYYLAWHLETILQ